MQEALEQFERDILAMRRGFEGERAKPHKLALILAVLDLAEDGLLNENKIAFDGQIFDRFVRYFEATRQGNDWMQIAPPFFFLKSSPFWFHKPKARREEEYALLKVGGGTKRITDNIEHALLSDYAFAVVQDKTARQKIRQLVLSLLSPSAAEDITAQMQNEPHKLGTAFHESFRLTRPVLKEVLRVVAESGAKKPTFDVFREQTKLGTNHIKAMRRYAFGAGLFDSNEQLTPFGRTVFEHDPALSSVTTQWMIHYFLTASHSSGPLFWAKLVERFFEAEGEIASEDVRKELAEFSQSSGANLAERTLKTTATIFLGSYFEADALGALNILRSLGEGRYEVSDEFAPRPLGVVACTLGDFWAARFGSVAKVNLSDVNGPSGLGRALLLSTGELLRLLSALQREGLVRLERATPPHQIARSWDEPGALWERLYEL